MEFALDPKTTFANIKLEKQNSASLRRKAKIFVNKLPQDFFQTRTAAVSETKPKPILRHQIHTQKISRKIPAIQRQSSTRDFNFRQGGSTSRLKYGSDALDLILSIISSTKQMKQQLQKHSSLIKRQSNIKINPEAFVQLPPLRLKKVSSDS